MTKISFILFLLSFCSQTLFAQHPVEVMDALSQCGENRKGLETMLTDYKRTSKEKYDAACYLVSNLPYNKQNYKVSSVDEEFIVLLSRADSTYYELVKDFNDAQLFNPHFNETVLAPIDQDFRGMMEKKVFCAPQIEYDVYSDTQCINECFLKDHIEHAFKLREQNPFTKRLLFDDFKKYVLPYRSLGLCPAEHISKYRQTFAKYLRADTARSISNVVWRYNITANRLHYWGGNYPFKENTGFYEQFFLSFQDCVPTADNCVSALRACGIPAAIEYNIAYKFWNGMHYHVSVPIGKGWETFSPESGLPAYRDPNFYEALNIYRIQFGLQPNNPYSLKNADEIIPDNLSDPRIEDVSNEIGEVLELTLPFNAETTNKLAYLASFHSLDLGLRPVTWGIINPKTQSVSFKNVIPDHLYFPIYLDENGDTYSFLRPFLLSRNKFNPKVPVINYIGEEKTKYVSACIERKFPRKPAMLELAKNVPGTCVIASDNADFTDADTIGVIQSIPSTKWEELELSVHRRYKYYRVCGTGSPARVFLSEIQFLTNREYQYENTIEQHQTLDKEINTENQWVRLLGEPLAKCSWKAEYDNNPQTAPDTWPHVTLKLPNPQYVHRLRYMVKHADNAVKPDVAYELKKWDDGFWRTIKRNLKTDSDIIRIDDLMDGELYWLRQMQGGKEEMPFVVDDFGNQHFPQLPFLQKLHDIKNKR